MATDYFIKQGDTSPPIVAILKDATLSPVDLTGISGIKFIMTNKATAVKRVDAPAVVVDAAGGRVRYDWATGDTDIPGGYKGEFEVHWPDGTYETFPNSKYINIKVTADLGGAVG